MECKLKMYCACGCGKITPVAKQSNTKRGWIKGEHVRCCYGHSPIKHVSHYTGGKEWKKENEGKHICKCGCGGYIKIKRHQRSQGIPQFIQGHHSKTDEMKKKLSSVSKKRIGKLSPRWKEDRSMVRGRKRNQVEFTKRMKREIYIRDKGVCQKCAVFCMMDTDINDYNKANIDHIIPVKDGGDNNLNNGQLLCLICHKFKHSVTANRMNSGKPKRKVVGNPEPSAQSAKVQRLLEHSDMLNNQHERPTRKG